MSWFDDVWNDNKRVEDVKGLRFLFGEGFYHCQEEGFQN